MSNARSSREPHSNRIVLGKSEWRFPAHLPDKAGCASFVLLPARTTVDDLLSQLNAQNSIVRYANRVRNLYRGRNVSRPWLHEVRQDRRKGAIEERRNQTAAAMRYPYSEDNYYLSKFFKDKENLARSQTAEIGVLVNIKTINLSIHPLSEWN